MTTKEQIFIEDWYRKLWKDIDMLDKKIDNIIETGESDFNELDECITEKLELMSVIGTLDTFIAFAGYEWRELETGWTLFEMDEE